MWDALFAAIGNLAKYLATLPEQDRQAAIDQMVAAGKDTVAKVAAFDQGSADDLAAAQARIKELEAQHAADAQSHAQLQETHAALVARAAAAGVT